MGKRSKLQQIQEVISGQHVMGGPIGFPLRDYHAARAARDAKAHHMDTCKGLRLARQALKNYRVDVVLCRDMRSFCIVRHDNSSQCII